MVAMPIASEDALKLGANTKGTYNDPAAKQSYQGRSKPAPWGSDSPASGSVGDIFTVMLGAAADEVPPWTYYPQVRDRYLRAFFRASDGLLAAAINNMQSKLRSLPYKVKAPGLRTQKKYSDLLGYANFGQGFASLLGQIAVDLYTQDNGWFIELIGAGASDRPLRGPILQLAALDANRCWRTFDPEYPVLYTNPYDGQWHKIHKTRIMYGSSFTQSDEMARGIGFCAESRALRYAQIARDIAIYKHEKLGGQFRRAIGYGNGYTPSQVDQALTMSKVQQDSQGLTRYSQIPFIMSGMDNAKLNLLDLASLPDGYDALTEMNLWAYILAFCFGTDAREFWPATSSGATKADATIQNMKAQGKGFAEDVKSIEHAINWFVFPDGVELEFDNQDDEQDQRVAALHYSHSQTVDMNIKNGTITPLEGRAILISKGVIDPAVLDTATAPVLADDSAPVDLETVSASAPALPAPATLPPPESQTGQTTLPTPAVKEMPDLRPGAGSYEEKTNAYLEQLMALFAGLLAALLKATNEAEVTDAISAFRAAYLKLLALGLTAAFGIGLAGKQPTEEGLAALQNAANNDLKYFDTSYLPDLKKAALAGLAVGAIEAALAAYESRLAIYAGDYWKSIWLGSGDHVAQMDGVIRVRRVLDPGAKHCNSCPPLAHEYDSYEAMIAEAGIPGDGSTPCLGNCRCTLEFETYPGAWGRLEGSPTVFTQPLIEVGQ